MTKNKEQGKKICFVIMPFSDPEGYEKGHFRKIYEQIFKPAIEAAGYEAHRVDENNESTLIQGKLLDQLVNAPMVLCDLSSKNPNVLYELGIRHAFDKPVVLVQEAGQAHIFDVAGISTVEYRKTRLYDEVVEDQKKIASAIQQTADTKKNYSIMSLAKLAHATMNHEESFSEEDRIEILLRDMAQRFAKIEEKITSISPIIYTNGSERKSDPDGGSESMKLRARTDLIRACETAENTLRLAKQNEPVEHEQVSAIYSILSMAIRTYRRQYVVSVEDSLHNRAISLKAELMEYLSNPK